MKLIISFTDALLIFQILSFIVPSPKPLAISTSYLHTPSISSQHSGSLLAQILDYISADITTTFIFILDSITQVPTCPTHTHKYTHKNIHTHQPEHWINSQIWAFIIQLLSSFFFFFSAHTTSRKRWRNHCLVFVIQF